MLRNFVANFVAFLINEFLKIRSILAKNATKLATKYFVTFFTTGPRRILSVHNLPSDTSLAKRIDSAQTLYVVHHLVRTSALRLRPGAGVFLQLCVPKSGKQPP